MDCLLRCAAPRPCATQCFVMPCCAMRCHANTPCSAMPHGAMSRGAMPRRPRPCGSVPRSATPLNASPQFYAMQCCSLPCYVTPCCAMPRIPSVMFLKHMFIGVSRVWSFPPASAAAFPDRDVLIGVTGDDGAAASGGMTSEVSPVFGSLAGLLSSSLLPFFFSSPYLVGTITRVRIP